MVGRSNWLLFRQVAPSRSITLLINIKHDQPLYEADCKCPLITDKQSETVLTNNQTVLDLQGQGRPPCQKARASLPNATSFL